MSNAQNKLNKRLGMAALAASFLAMSFAVIAPDGWDNVNEKPNYISVVDLAEKIKRREELLLLDLRANEVYDEFHLPTAENILKDDFSIADDNKLITIYYSDKGKDVVELWLSLSDRAKKKSFILYGGVDDWYSRLLYPKIPLNINPRDELIAKRIIDLSNFYGGSIEVIDDNHLLDYYRLDVSKSIPIYRNHTGVLRRKGC